MKKEDLVAKLYYSNIRFVISEKYEEDILVKRIEEIRELLDSEKGRMLPWREYADLSIKLMDCSKKLEEMRIRRETWEQIRELCFNVADEVLKED